MTKVTATVGQSDCTAQLLRLLIMNRESLQKFIEKNFSSPMVVDEVIGGLQRGLLGFYFSGEDEAGGFKFHLESGSLCSWCTMFSIQALGLWKKRDKLHNARWINHYI
jgi:hypothetical protein